MREKVLRQASRAGARIVLAECQRLAPKKTGRLAASLRIVTRSSPKGNAVRSRVKAKVGSSRQDPSGAYYAIFVERGHRIVTKQMLRKFKTTRRARAAAITSVKALPFMREAIKLAAPRVFAIFREVLARRIANILGIKYKRGR